jgi:methionyl-tRNA formyltransferase
MKIDILIDNKSSWFIPFGERLKIALSSDHNVRLIHNLEEMADGEILFILSCEKIIKKDKRNLYKHAVVVHASDLPSGKGWSPLSWQIVEGKNKIPLSMIYAVDRVDSGDIILKEEVNYTGLELLDELREKLGGTINQMCIWFTTNCSIVKHTPQDGVESFYNRRSPADSMLDIDKSIKEQFNLFRVSDNERYPAFFIYQGTKYNLKIEKVEE